MTYRRIGVIPAAGKAIRFGRIPKELLPLPDGRALIDHAVDRLQFCDRIVLVTSDEKLPFHQAIAGDRVTIVCQEGNEMFGAWMTACSLYKGDRYYMTMPDTYIDGSAFEGCPEAIEFALGLFDTYEPHRFGVLAEGGVRDKWDNAPVPAKAWGALMWSRKVYEEWAADKRLWDYTKAINNALHYGLNTWNIGKYFDCADAGRYGELWDYLRSK